ncbi:hypothetical protein QCA50_009615 [Cerrena zonata]|uniref:Ribosomal protein S6 n=1 Tax=Cerrena zonata TaxID=2478898 RepID=A0AAW0G066_9APHY
MPLYRMLCISPHYPDSTHIKKLVKTTALQVMNSGGVVRNIKSWGALTLPQRMRRHKQIYNVGHYWTMTFDTSPRTLKDLGASLRQDPAVIRWTMLKQGEKAEDIVTTREMTVSDR